MHTSAATQRIILVFGSALLIAGCASPTYKKAERDPKLGVMPSARVVEDGKPIPKGGGVYRVGKSYTVAGQRYVPHEKPVGFSHSGVASYYGRQFHGRLTANGEVFDMHGISAAHRTMPMPSYARVTNMKNGRSIIVRVNDRGPYHSNRIIDVSQRTAQLLDMTRAGVGHVKVDYVGRASLDGSDDKMLEASLRMDGSPATLGGASPVMVASAPKPFIAAPKPTSALVENLEEGPAVDAPLPTPVVAAAPMPKERPVAPALVAAAPEAEPAIPAQAMGFAAVSAAQRPQIAAAKPMLNLKNSAKTTLGTLY